MLIEKPAQNLEIQLTICCFITVNEPLILWLELMIKFVASLLSFWIYSYGHSRYLKLTNLCRVMPPKLPHFLLKLQAFVDFLLLVLLISLQTSTNLSLFIFSQPL